MDEEIVTLGSIQNLTYIICSEKQKAISCILVFGVKCIFKIVSSTHQKSQKRVRTDTVLKENLAFFNEHKADVLTTAHKELLILVGMSVCGFIVGFPVASLPPGSQHRINWAQLQGQALYQKSPVWGCAEVNKKK